MRIPRKFLNCLEMEVNGCWVWKPLSRARGDYGKIGWRGRTVVAHKWLYEELFGPIAPGLQLDHLCRNPRCVRPTHLEPVTARVNILRSTGPAALNAQKTHCIRGHEFTPENTRISNNGDHQSRVCRTCRRFRDAQRRAARTAQGVDGVTSSSSRALAPSGEASGSQDSALTYAANAGPQGRAVAVHPRSDSGVDQ